MNSSDASEEFKKEDNVLEEINKKIVNEITELVNQSKRDLSQKINSSIVYVYWNIGRIIVSSENEFNNRLEYGREVLKGLSNDLTKYIGKGYSFRKKRISKKKPSNFSNYNLNLNQKNLKFD